MQCTEIRSERDDPAQHGRYRSERRDLTGSEQAEHREEQQCEAAGDGHGEGDGDDTPAWRSPIGNPESTWKPQYADVREDRVVVYGYASRDVQEFVYRIKATNAGKFVIPPAFVESLYDRGVQARAPGGGTMTVERKP